MTIKTIDNVSVKTQANVYFDGKCVSHSLTLADGSKKSVGVMLPGNLTFTTGAAETLECVAGGCDYKLDGSSEWVKSSVGDSFSVAAKATFEIRVADGFDAYHYICHVG